MFGTRSRRARLAWAVGAIATLSLSSACGVLGSPEPESGADPAAAFQGKTMTWVVAYEAGDSQDIAARIIAEYFSSRCPATRRSRCRTCPAGRACRPEYVHKANPTASRCCSPVAPRRPSSCSSRTSRTRRSSTSTSRLQVDRRHRAGEPVDLDQHRQRLRTSTTHRQQRAGQGAATRPGSNTYSSWPPQGGHRRADRHRHRLRDRLRLRARPVPQRGAAPGRHLATLVTNHQGAPTTYCVRSWCSARTCRTTPRGRSSGMTACPERRS